MCVTTCNLYDECLHHQRVLTLCDERREKRLRTYHAQLAQQQQQQRPHTDKPRSSSLWNCFSGAFSPSPQPIPRPLLRPATTFTFVGQQPPKTATRHSCRASKIQQRTAVHPTACPNCEAARRTAQRAAQPTPQVGRQYYPRNIPPPVQTNPAPPPRAPPALRREVRRLPDKPLPALPPPRLVRQDATLSPALLGQAFALAPAGEFYDMYPPTRTTASNPMPRRSQQQTYPRPQEQTYQRPQQQTYQRPQQRQQQPPQQPNYHATRRHPLPPSSRPLPPPPLMTPAVARRAAAREPITRTPSPLSSIGSAWVRRPVSPISPGTRASNFRYVSPPAPAWD